MNASFAQNVIDGETVRRNSRTFLYKKDVNEILPKPKMLSCTKDGTFCRRHYELRATCHPVSFK